MKENRLETAKSRAQSVTGDRLVPGASEALLELSPTEESDGAIADSSALHTIFDNDPFADSSSRVQNSIAALILTWCNDIWRIALEK